MDKVLNFIANLAEKTGKIAQRDWDWTIELDETFKTEKESLRWILSRKQFKTEYKLRAICESIRENMVQFMQEVLDAWKLVVCVSTYLKSLGQKTNRETEISSLCMVHRNFLAIKFHLK